MVVTILWLYCEQYEQYTAEFFLTQLAQDWADNE